MPLLRACVGEAVGTFLLVFFGTGVIAASIITGGQVGLGQVAAVWGLGVAVAIYATRSTSGAHLNPAITLAFALFLRREFRISYVLPYWSAQLLGAIVAGLLIYALFGSFIEQFESVNGIIRGESGSERSAMIFGEYFPNPSLFGTGAEANLLVSPLQAALVEALGTAILVFMVFTMQVSGGAGVRTQLIAPLLIGLTVALIISVLSPLTQAGINPARDLGPRLVSYFAGWGEIAIPGPSAGFWVYIVGPLIGGPLGALVHRVVLGGAMRRGQQTDNPVVASSDP